MPTKRFSIEESLWRGVLEPYQKNDTAVIFKVTPVDFYSSIDLL